MRALRIPQSSDAADEPTAVPAWIIDGVRSERREQREAPRLEVPEDEAREPRADRRGRTDGLPAPGSTVVVIAL
jgi:hypothetical protein